MISQSKSVMLPAAALLAACTAALALTAGPAQAATTPPVKFGQTVFDPKGNDLPITNAKLNTEYVTVLNTTRSAQQLKGWTVRDSYGHTYVFSALALAAGKGVRLHTGAGKNTVTDVYWGQTKTYIWNNKGDKATLLKPDNSVAHTCSWTKKSNPSGTTSC